MKLLIILLLIGCMQQPKKRPHPLLYNLLEDKGGRVEKKQPPPADGEN